MSKLYRIQASPSINGSAVNKSYQIQVRRWFFFLFWWSSLESGRPGTDKDNNINNTPFKDYEDAEKYLIQKYNKGYIYQYGCYYRMYESYYY